MKPTLSILMFMKLYFHYWTILFFVIVMNAACSDEISHDSITEYSIPNNLDLDIEDETIITIRSVDEFNQFFDRTGISPNNINFERYNLLYIQGKSSYGITSISTKWEMTTNSYQLSITIAQNFTNPYLNWSLAFLISKTDSTPIVTSIFYVK